MDRVTESNSSQPRGGAASRGEQVDSLSGLVERVTFFNEENGFSVLKVGVKGFRDLVTVVGHLPSATAGEWLTAEGSWFRDRQFGLQFRARSLTCSAPSTREGIQKYLGSGMIKGIGPVYAQKLVAHFGEAIFDVIEEQSARLEEISGIGRERRKRIKEAWAEQKVIRSIMVFLHSHGVSTSRAVRIYKTYGEQAVERVRENPYRLAQDIPGIGFKTADQIAQRVGIPRDSLLRATAGLQHVLLEAAGEGHSALPVEVLREKALGLLEIAGEVLEQALERSLVNGDLVRETIEGSMWVFLPKLKRAEESVARSLDALRQGSPRYPAIDLERAVKWYEARSGKVLAEQQVKALATVLQARVTIITGGPGVGKTTLVQALVAILRAKKVQLLLAAPTGRAAKRLSESAQMEARTIHRLLEFNPRAGGFTRNPDAPLECDLLIVDEISMVDILLMNSLLRALPAEAGLVLVGDVDQLPSVGPGMVLKDLIESLAFPVVRLTEVFRQAAHSRIIANAHRINEGKMPETAGREEVSDFYFVEREEAPAVASLLLDMVRERVPRKFGFDPIRDVQVLCPMNRGSLGVHELNRALQEVLNPLRGEEAVVEKFGWQFRARDKVIQLENDYDKDVFNGDIGQIQRIDLEQQEAVIEFDQRAVVYEFGELDEIALAYAVTIHKAQGSEFPVVIIPLATQQYLLLQRNLIYTAVTRGKQLVVLVGQLKALAMAVRNNRVQHRYSSLRHQIKKLE